ncbi:MAG TPA: TVP38/TMEM64 family protein [Acidobacteriaceae bacterium]|nr:TVP38/TMEM64 family protein [Acidobacteriaceae bacterium]
MSKTVKFVLAAALIALLAIALIFLPLREWIIWSVAWVHSLGALGAAVYAIIYVLATVLMIPGSVLTLSAGFLYGVLWGMLLVSPASVVASTLAFLLGRSVARPWIQRRIAQNARFAAIDEAVGGNGFKVVFLLRLSPIFPFALLNYALGLTRVRLRDYVLGSFLGMLPGTFLYVYFGSSVANLASLSSGKAAHGGPWEHVLFWGGLAATLLVVVLVTRTARRALNQSLDTRSANADVSGGR